MRISERLDAQEWAELYAKLVYWELELEQNTDESMSEILSMQKKEANLQFCKFIENNYLNWLNDTSQMPQMLHTLLKNKIAPPIRRTT